MVKYVVFLILAVSVLYLCCQWYAEIWRRCHEADAGAREQARWLAYKQVWWLCLAAGALAFNLWFIDAALTQLTTGKDIAFTPYVQVLVAVMIASILLAVKAYFTPLVVCATVEWWLFEFFFRDEFSLRTPVQTLFDSFAEVFPESIRLVWALATLTFLTFNSLRVITAKADVSDLIP